MSSLLIDHCLEFSQANRRSCLFVIVHYGILSKELFDGDDCLGWFDAVSGDGVARAREVCARVAEVFARFVGCCRASDVGLLVGSGGCTLGAIGGAGQW